jgi:hypothetical protein
MVSRASGRIAAEGSCRIVSYDFTVGKPHPMPKELVDRILQVEGVESVKDLNAILKTSDKLTGVRPR